MKDPRTFALIIVMMIALGHRGMATDLRPVDVRFPWGSPHARAMTQLAVLIANENRLPALTYLVALQITLRGSGQRVYETTIEGRLLREYSQALLISQLLWRPLVAGQYDVTTTVTFDEEINPGNNTLTQTFTVLPPLLVAAVYWQNVLAPFRARSTSWAVVQQHMGPSAVWRYLNLRFLAASGMWYWLVRNRPIPPTADSLHVDAHVDLSSVIGTTVPDSVNVAIGLSDTVITTDTLLKGYTTLAYDSTTISRGGVVDTVPPPRIAVASAAPPPIGSTPRDGMYVGCNMPNMDLDASWFNSERFPEYAGDKNACGPTAAANSMEWLEKSFPAIRSGLHHREKLKDLSYAMRRYIEQGVYSEDFLLGKLEYINAYDLPISVKFQVRGSTANLESEDDYVSTAMNRGNGGYPTWDFLKQEVKDSEDVEMFFEYHRDSADAGSSVVGRHAVVISGAYETGTSKEFWYKDDGNQDTLGGTSETANTWQNLPSGEPYFDAYKDMNGAMNISVPFFICSESYDSTVHRKGRGGLERLWRGVKGLFTGPRVARDNTIDNDSLKPIRFSTTIAQRLAKPVANVPLGASLGTTVTIPLHDGYIRGADTITQLGMQIWYADTVGDATPLRRYDHAYSVTDLGDSTRDAAPSTGIETWVPSQGDLSWPDWSVGDVVITDSSLRWLAVPITDVDSTMVVPSWTDGLGSYGSSPQVIMSDIFGAIDRASDSIVFEHDAISRISLLTQLGQRTQQGTDREDVLRSSVLYIDEVRQPLRVRFQSASVMEPFINAGELGHGARNETGDGRGPDVGWMMDALDRSPLLIELARYNANGRIGGTWVMLNGVIEYNGGVRIIMDRDLGEGRVGGLRRTMNSIVVDGGLPCLAELSFGPERTIIETAISIAYDPTIVFTHVDDERERILASMSVRPNPAGDDVVIHADVATSAWARIELIDGQGSVLLVRDVRPSDLLVGIRCSLSDLPQGIIGVRVHTSNGVATRTVVHAP